MTVRLVFMDDIDGLKISDHYYVVTWFTWYVEGWVHFENKINTPLSFNSFIGYLYIFKSAGIYDDSVFSSVHFLRKRTTPVSP